MKKYLLIIFFLFGLTKILIGQTTNVQKVQYLEKRGGLLYWNGSPYTGQAIDFDGPTFDRTKLRYDGNYIDGQPNGRIKKWFPNYQLEYEENYNLGVLDGAQYYFYSSGKKKEEVFYSNGKLNGTHKKWDENGTLIYDFTFLHGAKEGKCSSYHSNGKIQKTGNYHFGIAVDSLIQEFDENGQLIQEEITRRNGEVKIYRNYNGDKISEETYENSFKVSDGDYNLSLEKIGEWRLYKTQKSSSPPKIYKKENYINNNLNGATVEYNDDGSIARTTFYKDGLVDLFAAHLVRYHVPNSEQILVGCPDVVNHKIAIVRITKPAGIYNPHFTKAGTGTRNVSRNTKEEKMLSHFIDNIINERGVFLINESELNKFERDTIFFDISISTPTINYSTGPVKYTNGSTGTGYCCMVTMNAYLTDIENKNVGAFDYSSSTCPRGKTSLGSQSKFCVSEDEAFNATINGGLAFIPQALEITGQVGRFLYNSFPICHQITSVDDRDGSNTAKRVSCKTSSYSGLPSNLKIDVYTEFALKNNLEGIGTLKIKEVSNEGIKLKVDEGSDKITQAFDNGEKLFIVSGKYK